MHSEILMIKLDNPKNKKIMYIAESQTDMDILHDFFDNKRLHGLYLLYDHKDKTKNHKQADFLQKNFPLAYGLAMVNME